MSNAIANPGDIGNTALSLFSAGAYGKGGYLLDTGSTEKEKAKHREKKAMLAQKKEPILESKQVEQVKAPTAPQADVNADILKQQGDVRRRRLLQQSTGNSLSGLNIQ